MDQSKINVRYAKAFFSLAKDKKLTLQLLDDTRLVSSVCKSSNDFITLLESPIISISGKELVMSKIFEGKIHPYTFNFLSLVIQNRREQQIPGIFRNIENLFMSDDSTKPASLTTAIELNKNLTDKIKEKIEQELKVKIELSLKIKPELIGGFVLRVEDNQYDASVSTQLKKINESLLNTNLN
jgi:F-type H+-transporting ATPase subunit delta